MLFMDAGGVREVFVQNVPFVIGIFALSLASSYVILALWLRGVRVRRAQAEELANAARLTYVDGAATLRSSYEAAGALALWEVIAKLPAFLRGFLEATAPWRLEGMREGIRVEVAEETRRNGKQSRTVYVFRAWYRESLPFKLRAGREGTLAKLGKALFALRDVQVGDGAFDDAVRVVSDDEDAAREFFYRPEPKAALLALLDRYPEAVMERDRSERERSGKMPDAAEVEEALALLVSLAKSAAR
jgi:hypothetical protein